LVSSFLLPVLLFSFELTFPCNAWRTVEFCNCLSKKPRRTAITATNAERELEGMVAGRAEQDARKRKKASVLMA
jgi:hypothetical protein